MYARLETLNFEPLGSFGAPSTGSPPNEEEDPDARSCDRRLLYSCTRPFRAIPCQHYQLRPQVARKGCRLSDPWSLRSSRCARRPTDAESDAESGPTSRSPTPRAPTSTAIRAPNPQAQSDAANTAEQAPAAAADAQRIEAIIITRANLPPRCRQPTRPALRQQTRRHRRRHRQACPPTSGRHATCCLAPRHHSRAASYHLDAATPAASAYLHTATQPWL